jgi:putative transient receptor potential channel
LAAEIGNQEIIDILLKNNAFVNVRNKMGLTPLHLAAKNGFHDMVEQLVIKHDAQVDPMSLVSESKLNKTNLSI